MGLFENIKNLSKEELKNRVITALTVAAMLDDAAPDSPFTQRYLPGMLVFGCYLADGKIENDEKFSDLFSETESFLREKGKV